MSSRVKTSIDMDKVWHEVVNDILYEVEYNYNQNEPHKNIFSENKYPEHEILSHFILLHEHNLIDFFNYWEDEKGILHVNYINLTKKGYEVLEMIKAGKKPYGMFFE